MDILVGQINILLHRGIASCITAVFIEWPLRELILQTADYINKEIITVGQGQNAVGPGIAKL